MGMVRFLIACASLGVIIPWVVIWAQGCTKELEDVQDTLQRLNHFSGSYVARVVANTVGVYLIKRVFELGCIFLCAFGGLTLLGIYNPHFSAANFYLFAGILAAFAANLAYFIEIGRKYNRYMSLAKLLPALIFFVVCLVVVSL